jgi:serine phosphatase RsbU (regulator of sigma subunit)
VLRPGGPTEVLLAADRVEVPGEPPLIEVTLVTEDLVPAPLKGAPKAGASKAAAAKADATRPGVAASAIQVMARRMDMVTSVTRLLLDNSTFSEAVTLQRSARLLAGAIATWAIVDMERGGQLRRQFALGPRSGPGDKLARAVRDADPQPGTVAWQVHTARKPLLVAHADAGAFGSGTDGAPLLLSLGATSLLCVPISDGVTSYGTLTLLRLGDEEPFSMADLSLAEVLGEHLGIAIRVDRMFRRRSEVAEALQASLMPARLPDIPGVELAAAYIPATNWPEISGDFYDVFPHGDGWAVAVGDVCGKGQDAAVMTAAARHAIRALAHHGGAGPEDQRKFPADVLAAASDVLLAGDYEERFVTAKLAFLRWRGRRLHVLLGGCGHPGPAVVRADGRVEILDGDGLPLGLFPDAQPSEGELELDDGDLLFFYSDGVTDARSARLGFLEDRLADELAAVAGGTAAETVRAVTDLVTEFSHSELRDDVTILALKVNAASG